MVRFLKKRPFILFLLPALVLYTLFYSYPVLSSIPYSLTKWSGIGTPQFVGFNNYKMLFENPIMKKQMVNALGNNLYLLVGALFFLTPFIVFLAYSLYRKIPFANFFKVTIFLPYFINIVAIGVLSTLIMDPNTGILAMVGRFFNTSLVPADMFANRFYTVPYILLVSTWNSVGYCMLIVLSNLMLVPQSLVEAALIDGAGEWKCFWRIYFPLIRPSFVNILVLNYVWAISIFDIPYILGGLNGGVGYKMDFLSVFYYRTTFSASYVENAMGMGTMLAVFISVIAMSGTFIIMRLLKRRGEDMY